MLQLDPDSLSIAGPEKQAVQTLDGLPADPALLPRCLQNPHWGTAALPDQAIKDGAAIAVKSRDGPAVLAVSVDPDTGDMLVHEGNSFTSNGTPKRQWFSGDAQASGPDRVRSTFGYDTDQRGSGGVADLFWAAPRAGVHELRPQNDAQIALCSQRFSPEPLSTADAFLRNAQPGEAPALMPGCAAPAIAWKKQAGIAELYRVPHVVLSQEGRLAVLRSHVQFDRQSFRAEGEYTFSKAALRDGEDGLIIERIQVYHMQNGRLRPAGEDHEAAFSRSPFQNRASFDMDERRARWYFGRTVDDRVPRTADFRWIYEPPHYGSIFAVNGAWIAPCGPSSVTLAPASQETEAVPDPSAIADICYEPGANGRACVSGAACDSRYCADNARCAPVDHTGDIGTYCHHDNHCMTGRCNCPGGQDMLGRCADFDRLGDQQIRDYMERRQFVCGPPRAGRKACSGDSICSKGEICDYGVCRPGCREGQQQCPYNTYCEPSSLSCMTIEQIETARICRR